MSPQICHVISHHFTNDKSGQQRGKYGDTSGVVNVVLQSFPAVLQSACSVVLEFEKNHMMGAIQNTGTPKHHLGVSSMLIWYISSLSNSSPSLHHRLKQEDKPLPPKTTSSKSKTSTILTMIVVPSLSQWTLR